MSKSILKNILSDDQYSRSLQQSKEITAFHTDLREYSKKDLRILIASIFDNQLNFSNKESHYIKLSQKEGVTLLEGLSFMISTDIMINNLSNNHKYVDKIKKLLLKIRDTFDISLKDSKHVTLYTGGVSDQEDLRDWIQDELSPKEE